MLTDLSTWERLKKLGVLKWIDEKKESGEIRNIGFSYHGGKTEFIKLIDAYDWEFCMIQYNYLDENIKVASQSEINAFSSTEKTMFENVKNVLQKKIKVPCTGCNYCMPCPVGVDIPTCLSCYNDIEIEGRVGASVKYMMQTSLKSKPHNASLCVKCGKCEEHCPQDIKIMKELKEVSRKLEGIHYRPAPFVLKKFMKL